MTENEKVSLANPAALGLFGLSVIAMALAAEMFGWADADPIMALQPWVFFIGGLALIIAALFEFKLGDVFAGTFFGAFGLFWFAIGQPWWEVTIGWEQLGFIIIAYFIFFAYMTFAAASKDMVKLLVLVFSMLTFAGLAVLVFFDTAPELVGLTAILLAAVSFYASAAVLLRAMAGFDVLPVGKPLLTFKKIEL